MALNTREFLHIYMRVYAYIQMYRDSTYIKVKSVKKIKKNLRQSEDKVHVFVECDV